MENKNLISNPAVELVNAAGLNMASAPTANLVLLGDIKIEGSGVETKPNQLESYEM